VLKEVSHKWPVTKTTDRTETETRILIVVNQSVFAWVLGRELSDRILREFDLRVVHIRVEIDEIRYDVADDLLA